MESSSSPLQKAAKLPQILGALAGERFYGAMSINQQAAFGGFSLGAAISWSSPALLYINEDLCLPNDCDITGVSGDEASWIASCVSLGALTSGITASYLMNRIGRRWTMILNAVPMAIGFSSYVIANAVDDKALIYVGNLLTGFASGSCIILGPTYTTEIAEISMRGTLGVTLNLAITMGQVMVNALSINGAVHWDIVSAICIGIPVALATSMLLMPDTPRFWIAKQKEAKAAEALQWFRGSHYDITEELKTMVKDYERQKSVKSIKIKALFTDQIYLKPFLLIMLLIFLNQLSGISFFFRYTQEIFRDAGSDLDEGISATLVLLSKAVGSITAILLIDKFGRRVLIGFSQVMVCACLFPLATFFYIQENSCRAHDATDDCDESDMNFSNSTVDDLGWLPLTSLMVYMTTFAIGMGPIPWTVNAEIQPAESKQLAYSILSVFNWIYSFLVIKFGPDLEEAMGTYGLFYLFAAVSVAGTIAVYFLLPETKGKTVEEIRHLFVKDGEEKKVKERSSSLSSQETKDDDSVKSVK